MHAFATSFHAVNQISECDRPTTIPRRLSLTQVDFLSRVRRKYKREEGEKWDEDALYDEIERVVQSLAADVDLERHILVHVVAAGIVNLVADRRRALRQTNSRVNNRFSKKHIRYVSKDTYSILGTIFSIFSASEIKNIYIHTKSIFLVSTLRSLYHSLIGSMLKWVVATWEELLLEKS